MKLLLVVLLLCQSSRESDGHLRYQGDAGDVCDTLTRAQCRITVCGGDDVCDLE